MFSLFHLPASFGDTVTFFLSAPLVFAVSLLRGGILLHFLTRLSLLAWFFGGFLTLVSLCYLRSSLVPFSSFLLPLGLSFHFFFFCARVSFCHAPSSFFRFSPLVCHLRVFRHLPLLSVLPPQFPCAILSFSRWVGFVGSPSLPLFFFGVLGSPTSFC